MLTGWALQALRRIFRPGYHLKQNLWLNEKYSSVLLEDSIA